MNATADRALGWAASLFLHTALFGALAWAGLHASAGTEQETVAAGPVSTRLEDPPPRPPPPPSSGARPARTDAPPVSPAPVAPPRAAATPSAPAAPGRGAEFAGVTAPVARRVAFVVDASGSMVGAFAAIAQELSRSVEALDSSQEFFVLAFQSGRAIALPPARPAAARPGMGGYAEEWLTAVVRPSGTSSPLEAIQTALSAEPDVLFLLGSGAAPGRSFGIGCEALLEEIELLNGPVGAGGTRRTRIHAIECLGQDPEECLRRIARANGGEYRFLSGEDLGLLRQREQAP